MLEHSKGYLFTALVTAVFTLMSWPSLIAIASYLETKYYPVVLDFEVSDWQRTADNYSIIFGKYTRTRNCTFKHIDWFMKAQYSDIAIPIQRVPRDADRPPGVYTFGPWKIFASPEELEKDSYAIVHHNCHPFYDTQSIIYAKGKFK